MPSTSTKKSAIQYIGLALFALSLLIFTAMPALESYQLAEQDFVETVIPAPGEEASEKEQYIYGIKREGFLNAVQQTGITENEYGSSLSFNKAIKNTYLQAKANIEATVAETELPEDVSKWDIIPGNLVFFKESFAALTTSAERGPVKSNPWLFFLLTIGLGVLGGILYIIPKFQAPEGIKHDHIYHSQLTKGLDLGWRTVFLTAATLGTLAYGVYYMADDYMWPMVTAVVALAIIGIVLFVQNSFRRDVRDAGPEGMSGYLGILGGTFLIGFYILLYWAPQHITPWVAMVDPFKQAVFGSGASQWFLYGLLYTLIILVMGVRMIAKYRHNKYQIIRTASVMFFQTSFAFILLEVLGALNLPQQDLKNIWPLDYDFFFGWQLDQFQSAGAIGTFMLVWGIILIVIGVPLMVHLVGKRWYCSWVCGCGGLAETMGDPWRQLSDKSLRAWKFERWIIHGVLVAAILMTALTLYTYFSGASSVLGFETWKVQRWYGFLIGAGFAGVVGTGFYPLMGNRVWCRFGCPLAAYLGLVQRFQSRFRITTNGGQCISCGNCSTYCEMGIDVRAYAQKGQDVVRASCVGCGVCAAVCPRGVLRLENGSEDLGSRAVSKRVIHIEDNSIEANRTERPLVFDEADGVTIM